VTFVGIDADITVSFVDDARPRRMRAASFELRSPTGSRTRIDVEAQGPAVAMPGLGYGGYDDGLGLGVWRGVTHLESEIWDVAHPAEVGYPDGSTGRPVHRIQPVKVVETGPDGVTSEGTGASRSSPKGHSKGSPFVRHKKLDGLVINFSATDVH